MRLYANRSGLFAPLQSFSIDNTLNRATFITGSLFLVGAANGTIYAGDENGANVGPIGSIGSAVQSIFIGNRNAIVVSVQAVMFVFSVNSLSYDSCWSYLKSKSR